MILDPTLIVIYVAIALIPPALLGLRLMRRRKICGEVLLEVPMGFPPGFLWKNQLKTDGVIIALLLLVSLWFEPEFLRGLAAWFAIMAASGCLLNGVAKPSVTLCDNGIWLGPMSGLLDWKDIKSFERLPRDPARLTLWTHKSRYFEPPIDPTWAPAVEAILEEHSIKRHN
jgi:hypothetical protein